MNISLLCFIAALSFGDPFVWFGCTEFNCNRCVTDYVWEESSHRQTLHAQRDFLVNEMDTEGTLLPFLLQHKVLDEEELDEIKALTVRHERNAKLLDFIVRTTLMQYYRFLEAVKKSKQDRLHNKLLCCGIESLLAVDDLTEECSTSHRDCQPSLKRLDSVSTFNSPTAPADEGPAACVMGNTLYVAGIGRAYNELWKWNAASDWTRCADMTSYRRYHCAAVVDSTLYALGGWGADGITLSSIESYNPHINEWSAAGRLTHAVRLAACVSYNKYICVLGGRDVNHEDVTHVQIYDTVKRKCTLLPSKMAREYAYMRAVVWETYAPLVDKIHTQTKFYNSLGCYSRFIK